MQRLAQFLGCWWLLPFPLGCAKGYLLHGSIWELEGGSLPAAVFDHSCAKGHLSTYNDQQQCDYTKTTISKTSLDLSGLRVGGPKKLSALVCMNFWHWKPQGYTGSPHQISLFPEWLRDNLALQQAPTTQESHCSELWGQPFVLFFPNQENTL